MSWWDGCSYDRIRVLRDSLRMDHKQFDNAPLGARGRNNLKARIIFQEKQLKELNTQRRVAVKARKARELKAYEPEGVYKGH